MYNSILRFFLCAGICLGIGSFTYAPIINDFSQINPTKVEHIFYPETNNQICNLVAKAHQEGKKLSIAGKRHSQGGHAFYPGAYVIDISHFNKIIQLDPVAKIITVQTGATWEQIQDYINPHGLAIKVMQTAQIFTVGGSLSVNAHGRDPHYSSLIETIRGIRILLASGKIVHASRTENYDLFKLAIGGYGLFGIILEADIELTDNVVYKKTAQIIKMDEYPIYLRNHIINNDAVGLHYGFVSLSPYNAFKELLAVEHRKFEPCESIPDNAYVLEKEKFANIVQWGIELKREYFWIYSTSLFFLWPAHVLTEKIPHITCRNNVMRHPVERFAHQVKSNVDILQSYFIPATQFADFMQFLSTHNEHSSRIFYALTRYIPKNNESFLSYGTKDYIEVVLFINHGIDDNSIKEIELWTQTVVDEVLSYGGCYYLPTCLYPKKIQLEKAYPQFTEFLKKKREYDPNELFVNCFYMHYKE